MKYSLDRNICKCCLGFEFTAGTDIVACYNIPQFEDEICPCSICLVKCICNVTIPTIYEDTLEEEEGDICEELNNYFFKFKHWQVSLTEEELKQFETDREESSIIISEGE